MQKLEAKKRRDKRVTRIYGFPQTPYGRVFSAPEVSDEKKAHLKRLHQQLNPSQLIRDIERQKKQINARRLLHA